ncbi:hypothetical protein BJX70DRAFT_354351 [Aspergillus crustosus]
MNISNMFSDRNLQDTFLPGPMLNSLEFSTNLSEPQEPTSDMLMIPGLRNNPNFGSFGTLPPQSMDLSNWGNHMNFSGTNLEPAIRTGPAMTNNPYQGLYDHNNSRNSTDIFSVNSTEIDGEMQNDKSNMAFI